MFSQYHRGVQVIDISRTIEPDSTIYPGDLPLRFDWFASMDQGAAWNELMIHNWTGHRMTHIDAPKHFMKDGASIDSFSAESFIMPAVVVEIDDNVITSKHIDALGSVVNKAVLFKTRNSEHADHDPYDAHAVYLDGSAGHSLVKKKPRLEGIDYLSVDNDEVCSVHHALLEAGILILEGAQLRDAEPGEYTLIALPLKIKGADGSCVRAVLTRD